MKYIIQKRVHLVGLSYICVSRSHGSENIKRVLGTQNVGTFLSRPNCNIFKDYEVFKLYK
jgi:hypothetical protein